MPGMPPPPSGFTLDASTPPPGFKLDVAAKPSVPPPPPGFTIDSGKLNNVLKAGAESAYAPFKPVVDRVLSAAEDIGKTESEPSKDAPGLENPRTGLPFKSAMNVDKPLRIAADVGAATPAPALAGALGQTAETMAARTAGVNEKKAQELGEDTGDLMAMAGGVASKDLLAREKIASPAIKDGEQVYTGKNHEEIRQSMPETANKGADANTGFVTDKGRFVSREEADKLAKANGQFKQEVKAPDALHSEELKSPAEPIGPPQKSKIFSDDQPTASTQPVSSVKGVADKLYQSRGEIKADYKEFSQWANQFKDVPKDFWQKALDHLDDPKGTPLSPEEKIIFDRSVGIMKDEIDAARKEIKAAGFEPGYLEEQSDSLGGAVRQRKGAGTPMDKLTGTKTEPVPPESGRSLSRNAGTFKGRTMMALVKDGERQVVHVDKQGNVYDAATRDDPIGTVDENGKFQGEGNLQEATRKEIEKATNGAIQYHDNAFGVYGTTLLQTRRALRSVRVLEEIKKSPDFNLIAHGPLSEGSIPKGWKEIPDAPEFRGYRFDPKYAEEIEDFIHGTKFDAGELNKLDRINRFMLNTSFWANPYHMFNMNNAFTVTKGLGGLVKDLPGTAMDLFKSIKSVAIRDKFNMAQARAGVPMRGLDAAGEDFQKKVLDIMGVKMRQDPQNFAQWAKRFGFDAPKDFYSYVSKMSHKATFSWQDILQQTLERGYTRQGLSRAQATEKSAKTFMDYRSPARVGDQRWIGQALQGQAWLNFPKYAYGRASGLYKILDGVVRQRDLHALDQLITIGVLYEFGQHVINPVLKDLTGNPDAELSDFGYEVFPAMIDNLVHGKRTVGQTVQNTFAPGYIPQTYDLATGVEPYTGKPISIPGESGKEVLFDYANEIANRFAPVQKYNQLQRGRVSPGDAMLEQLGVKFPTDPSELKSVRRQLKARDKRGNPVENLYDEVTGQ